MCRHGGTFLNKMQSVHEKPIDNIIWHREKLEAIAIKSGARDEFPLSPVHFSTVLGILVGAIKQEKEIKGVHKGKEVSTTLFADEMILYMRHPKNSTRNLLATVNHLSNVQNTKSMCTSWYTLYANRKHTEEEIVNTLSFTIASKRIF